MSGKLVQDIDCYRYREAQAASRRKNPGHCKRAVGARSCGNYITLSPHRAPLGAKHVTVSHLKALNMCGGSVIPQLRAPTVRLQWPGFCRHYVAHISCLWFRNILPDTNKNNLTCQRHVPTIRGGLQPPLPGRASAGASDGEVAGSGTEGETVGVAVPGGGEGEIYVMSQGESHAVETRGIEI